MRWQCDDASRHRQREGSVQSALSAAVADEIAELAAIAVDEVSADRILTRVVQLVTTHVEGCDAAGVTVENSPGEDTFAASDPRITSIHQAQFDTEQGPALEALRYGEARHLPSASADDRWPVFRSVATDAGFESCLALPVRTDRSGSGALCLYAVQPEVFSGRPHDIALMLAAETGVAMHNTRVYHDARRAADNLRTAVQ